MTAVRSENSVSRAAPGFALVATAIWLPTLWQDLRVWSAAPESYFGCVVPILAAYLLRERWTTRPAANAANRTPAMLGLVGCGALWSVALVFLEPFPQWPAMLWLFNGAAVGLSIALAAATGGRRWAAHFAFPFAFVLSSLPWPTFIRHAWIDRLGPAVSATATTFVNEFVGPALRHGNVIETASGVLGMQEACTGLRSIEATFVVALFAGEYFRATLARRLALLAAAAVLAFVGNTARVAFVTWKAVADGAVAAEAAHDTAGYAVVVLTLPLLLLVAWAWRRRDVPAEGQLSGRIAPNRRFAAVALGLIVTGVVASTLWYSDLGGSGDDVASSWSIELPRGDPSFRPVAFSSAAYALLACDDGAGGLWRTSDGARRAAYFARWQHGHEAAFRLDLHNPQICLPLAGARLLGSVAPESVPLNGRTLTFAGWAFEDASGPFVVFSSAVRMPTGTPLEPAPISFADWMRWRWRIVRSRERDERILLLTIGLWDTGQDPAAIRGALRQEVRAIVVTPAAK